MTENDENRLRRQTGKPTPINGRLGTESVLLRPLARDDIESLRRWRARDDVRVWFGDRDVVTPEAQARWFERYLAKSDDVMFTIELDGLPVGAVALYAIDVHAREAEFGRLMLGEPAARGRRVADRASAALCAWGFGELRLQRIYLWVRHENQPAIALYDRMGFKQCESSPDAREGFHLMELRAPHR